jgi:hypothetical protein
MLSTVAILGAVLWVVHEALRARKIFELAQQPAVAGSVDTIPVTS